MARITKLNFKEENKMMNEMISKETMSKETNVRLLYLLESLTIQKHQDYRNDGKYQKDIDIIKAEILCRMESK